MTQADNILDVYPLSPLQEGMLFHGCLAPESSAYVEQLGATLRGEVDVAAFKAAWQSLIERHAILRTAFNWKIRQEPFQVVQRKVELPWSYEVWCGQDAAEQAVRLAALRRAERARGFDFQRPPLLRLHL